MTEEIRDVLNEIGYSLRDAGAFYRARPIYRESNNNTSLSICKRTGYFVDFSANISGQLEDLVKLTLKLKTVDEAKKWLENKIDVTTLKKNKVLLKTAKIYPPELLNELLPIHDYWTGRGISLETIRIFKGGLVKRGQMANRYTFPIFNDRNQIIGFVGRDTYNNTDRPKYKIVGNKLNFIWPAFINSEIIRKEKIVVLVESPACVLKCWDLGIKNVICLFGVKLSPKITSFLLKLDINKIIIATNNEPDNASIGNNAALAIRDTLINLFDKEQVIVSLPSGKDIAEMSDDKILEWYNQSIGQSVKVVHCKKEPHDVYIGRPSKWGNPFEIGKDGTREEVIDKYRKWIEGQEDLIKDLPELKGKILGCWCRPENSCHGDVLAELVNKYL